MQILINLEKTSYVLGSEHWEMIFKSTSHSALRTQRGNQPHVFLCLPLRGSIFHF